VSSNNQLSWQSAFFGLMGIYGAILVQNAGAIGGLDGDYRFALRTSPLVTAADTAMLIIKLVWLILRGLDLRSAARIVWEDPG
jgi:hypothetical protein